MFVVPILILVFVSFLVSLPHVVALALSLATLGVVTLTLSLSALGVVTLMSLAHVPVLLGHEDEVEEHLGDLEGFAVVPRLMLTHATRVSPHAGAAGVVALRPLSIGMAVVSLVLGAGLAA